MPTCTQMCDCIWRTQRGFCLVETGLQLQAGTSSFLSSPSHSIEKLPHMTDFMVWGRGKQARRSRWHCPDPAVCESACGGWFTSGAGEACRLALYGGVQVSGGCSRYREYVETLRNLGQHGGTRVWHRLPWCWHLWAYHIGCYPAAGVASQEGHNLQVLVLDTRTRGRYAARDDMHCYNQSNLQPMLLNQVCNTWNCHLHTERCTTCAWHWDFVQRWGAAVPAGAPHSAPLH